MNTPAETVRAYFVRFVVPCLIDPRSLHVETRDAVAALSSSPVCHETVRAYFVGFVVPCRIDPRSLHVETRAAVAATLFTSRLPKPFVHPQRRQRRSQVSRARGLLEPVERRSCEAIFGEAETWLVRMAGSKRRIVSKAMNAAASSSSASLGFADFAVDLPCDAGAVIRQCALALAVILGCDKPADDCQRAFARLARIDQAKGFPTRSKAATERMLEVCRTGKYAAYDPVLRCAMDSSSDDVAAECIDRGIKEVLRPSAGGSGDGAGLNPLLQE